MLADSKKGKIGLGGGEEVRGQGRTLPLPPGPFCAQAVVS